MALTQQEFLDIVTIVDPTGQQVHIWYDENTDQILGLTIPTVFNNQNVLGYLQQLEKIVIPINTTETVILTILDRSFINQAYYFFTVEPYPIGNISDNLNYPSSLIFIPEILGLIFVNGDYNALFNNIQDIRQSSYIKQGTSEILAFVQDSLYQDTGWIRGRYDGTKTNFQDFSTISPILEGGEFEGSYFTLASTNEYIFALPNNEKVFNNYFFSGEGTLPSYEVIQTTAKRSSIFPISGTTDSFTISGSDTLTTSSLTIQVGDLLRLGSGSTEVPSPEIVKVLSITNLTGISQEIKVQRRWNLTTQVDLTDPSEFALSGRGKIYKINPVRIFNLSGNRVEVPSQGRIQIRSTQDIIDIDELGFIVTGSNYVIPTP